MIGKPNSRAPDLRLGLISRFKRHAQRESYPFRTASPKAHLALPIEFLIPGARHGAKLFYRCEEKLEEVDFDRWEETTVIIWLEIDRAQAGHLFHTTLAATHLPAVGDPAVSAVAGLLQPATTTSGSRDKGAGLSLHRIDQAL